MTDLNQNASIVPIVITPDDNARDRIFVTIGGDEWQRGLDEIGLSFESSEREIMDRVVPIISETFGQDIRNHYKIRKATTNRNVFIYPNSTAG
jgi:hypothetical protein